MNYIYLTETQAIDIGNILSRYQKYVDYKFEEISIKLEKDGDGVLSEVRKLDLDNLSKELDLIQESLMCLGLNQANN